MTEVESIEAMIEYFIRRNTELRKENARLKVRVEQLEINLRGNIDYAYISRPSYVVKHHDGGTTTIEPESNGQ